LIKTCLAIVAQPAITLRERQLCVLACCSVFHAQFMTYAHIKIGKQVKLTSEQILDARTGRVPKGLPEGETAAYVFSKALAEANGPVSDEIYEKAERILGKDRMVGLIHCVGLYTYTSMVMNASDVPVPDGEKIEFGCFGLLYFLMMILLFFCEASLEPISCLDKLPLRSYGPVMNLKTSCDSGPHYPNKLGLDLKLARRPGSPVA
jgi:hypothetical protein